MSLERAMNTITRVKISFCQSFTYHKKNGFEYCCAKGMTEILTFPSKKIWGCGGSRVGISIECDKDPELWSTYTRRTFWAIPWINDNFWWSKLAKNQVGHFGGFNYPGVFWPLCTPVSYCKLLIIIYSLLNFGLSKIFSFWEPLV